MRQEDCFCYKILIDEYISGYIAMNNIKLIPLEDRDREQFILDNQEAFNYGALEEFGRRDDHFEEDEQIISRETIEKSIKEYGCSIIYFIIDRDNSLKVELEGQEKDSASILEFRYIYGIDEVE